MKLTPAKVGAQPKQMIVLGALVVLLIVVYLINRGPSAPQASSVATRTQPATVTKPLETQAVAPVTRKSPQMRESPLPGQRGAMRGESRSTEDFRPTLKLKEGTDVSRIDPTLELELLAKLRNTPMEGGARSIFEFGQPPPPPPPPKVDPIKMGKPSAAPPTAAKTPAEKEKEAKALAAATSGPPLPFKFYGYADSPKSGPKRAFFLDGDEIFVAGENDLIRNRYKIIRIGVNSAVLEDTTTKKQQTIKLVEELAS